MFDVLGDGAMHDILRRIERSKGPTCVCKGLHIAEMRHLGSMVRGQKSLTREDIGVGCIGDAEMAQMFEKQRIKAQSDT